MKPVIVEQKPKRYSLQNQEYKKSSVPADKKKYVTHGKPSNLPCRENLQELLLWYTCQGKFALK